MKHFGKKNAGARLDPLFPGRCRRLGLRSQVAPLRSLLSSAAAKVYIFSGRCKLYYSFNTEKPYF